MSRRSTGGGNKAAAAAVGGDTSASGASEPAIELESQFLLRLPEEPAAALRAALRSGATNIKERLSISLKPENPADPRLRRAIVEFDSWTNMSAKLMDLPTIVESHKSIDRKSFYKTADICQMLWCKEGDPSDEDDDADNANAGGDKGKKYDPNKVEKKWVYPHGITPPMKNCRKRRFRKTLKKRYIDAPENEKEVKHLLRQDLDAVRFSFELITEDEMKQSASKQNPDQAPGKKSKKGVDQPDTAEEATVDEANIFGGEISESDEEDMHNTSNIDVDDDSNTLGGPAAAVGAGGPTASSSMQEFPAGPSTSGGAVGPTQFSSSMFGGPKPQEHIASKTERLNQEVALLRKRKLDLESNVANCDNLALLQRFKASLAQLEDELRQKEEDLDSLSMFS